MDDGVAIAKPPCVVVDVVDFVKVKHDLNLLNAIFMIAFCAVFTGVTAYFCLSYYDDFGRRSMRLPLAAIR